MNEIMLELAEELVDPAEAVLDDQVEDTIETEEDIMIGIGDDDDDVIDFISSGKRFENSDPVDYTDDDVEETVEDDDEPTGIDDIEESFSYLY